MNPQADGQPETSQTVHQWRHLANRHEVGWTETLLIALNIHGLHTGDAGTTVRLKVQPPDEGEVFQMVLPAGRDTSPFSVDGTDHLCVDGTPVASVLELRADNAVGGYLRAGGLAATIRPFAGGDNPQPAAVEEAYAKLLANLAISLPIERTLADVEEVTVSGDEYVSEDAALRDLANLRNAMTRLSMRARIGLLSSTVRGPEAMARLAETVAPFTLFLNADHPPGVEADVEGPAKALAGARAAGHDTSFTYTVGKDPLDAMREQLLPLAQYTTVWPSLYILQTTSDGEAAHIAEPAERLDFFLQARTMLERIFAPTSLIPEPWRCYRGLWYREYAGDPLPGPWI
ncbi:MAG: hypothetical protein ACRDXX_01270 [Stackebrandtia sp.]